MTFEALGGALSENETFTPSPGRHLSKHLSKHQAQVLIEGLEYKADSSIDLRKLTSGNILLRSKP